MVPSYPSRAPPCPAQSCRAGNCRRVADDASRALILYDAATQRKKGEINLLQSPLVASAPRRRESEGISGSRLGSRKRARPAMRT